MDKVDMAKQIIKKVDVIVEELRKGKDVKIKCNTDGKVNFKTISEGRMK